MGETRLEWLFSAGELEQTPSIKLGMSVQNERLLRQKCQLFILELGRNLQCNHLVISAASIMFQRFMAFQAFQNYDRFIICATCVFLAGKVEEQPKRLQDVVDRFFEIRAKKTKNKLIESELKIVENKILVAERILLQTLGFDLQIDHPYGYCMHLLKSQKPAFTSEAARGESDEETRKELNEEARKEVKRLAMGLLTDSFCDVICLEYSAEVFATAVTFLAVLSLGLPSPSAGNRGGVFRRGPGDVKTTTWLELFLSASKGNVSEVDLKACCSRVIAVYEDKVIAIANATGADNSSVKENNLLRMKLQQECKQHEEWSALPIVADEPAATSAPSASAGSVAPVVTRAPPPPPPPKSMGGKAPRPPPSRPSQKLTGVGGLVPPKPLVVVKLASANLLAPPTPDMLPPPTPDNIPPPTPECMMPPPTPECMPPPTPECMPPPTPECMPPPTPEYMMPPPTPEQLAPPTPVYSPPPQSAGECSDNDERARKRRAEDRVYSGNANNGRNGIENGGSISGLNNVHLDKISGKAVNGRNDDESSPPKKYKM